MIIIYILIIVALILVSTGVFFLISSKETKGKPTKNNSIDEAYKIILDNYIDYSKEDLKLIEKTGDKTYKILDKRSSEDKLKYYFIVDIEKKSYYVKSEDIVGG